LMRRLHMRLKMLSVSLLILGTAFPALASPPVGNQTGGPAKITPQTLAELSRGSTVRAWVFFADKGQRTPEQLERALANRRAELSDRTLRRRALRGSGAAERYEDLAVDPGYRAQIQATGAKLRQQSRWLNAVSVEATKGQ